MCFRATNNVHFIYYPSVVSNGKNSTLKFVILSSLSVGVNNDYSENPSLSLIGYKMTDLKKKTLRDRLKIVRTSERPNKIKKLRKQI